MKNEKLEIRRITELRANGEDRIISGTAIVFNSESELLNGIFTEIIKPEAVSAELIASSDIIMLFNHEDDNIPMARSKNGKGTLSISITATGVDFSFAARNTPQGDEILAAVRAGDVDSCSFAFCVADEGDNWFSKPDGTYLRTITKFESLHDFSLVNDPAYVAASCRSLDKFKETRETPPAPPTEPEPVVPATPATPEPVPATPEFDIEAYYAPYEATIAENSK